MNAMEETLENSNPLPEPEDAGAPQPEPPTEPDPEPELQTAPEPESPAEPETVSADELLGEPESKPPLAEEEARLRAVVEAIIYVTEEPLTAAQIAAALEIPLDRLTGILAALNEDYARPERGVTIREVAGGYKMGTKPEHHEAVRTFVKKLKPPLKLSLAALETLAVIAYKQPITAPEIMEIRGVQGGGVLKTLIDRKLIMPAGRKQVVGKPILYKTTKEFLLQFGLKDLSELPTLKEFEELRRLALPDDTVEPDEPEEQPPLPQPEPDVPPIPEPEPEPGQEAATSNEPAAVEAKPAPESPVEAESGSEESEGEPERSSSK